MKEKIKLMKIHLKIFTTILSVVACFGLLSRAQAQEGNIGNGNTVEGFKALNSSTVSGSFNTGLGWFSQGFITDGLFNTAAGAGSLDVNINGDSNSAFGTGAMLLNIGNGADNNTAVGTNALLNNSFTATNPATALDNTGVGFEALFTNLDGADNTAVGSGALFSNLVSGLTAVGFGALEDNTFGFHNVAVGNLALTDNTLGFNNTAVGGEALEFNTIGINNTAVGWFSSLNTTGSNNTTMGSLNPAGIAIGITTGAANVTVGRNAGLGITLGDNNTILGDSAGSSFNTRTHNVYIGQNVNPNFTGVFGPFEDNFIRIANSGPPQDNTNVNQSRIYVGAPGVATTAANGSLYNAQVPAAGLRALRIAPSGQIAGVTGSSVRYKKDIKPMDTASESILALRPVIFHYKTDETNTLCFGLIAEEVAKVDPSLVINDKDGRPESVVYEEIPMRLLNEFLKEHKKVEQQQASISQLKSEMQTMVAQLKEQAAQIQKVSAQLEVGKAAPQVVVNKP